MRPIDADALARRMCELCNQYYSDDPCEPSDCIFAWAVKEAPTLAPPNEPLTCEGCACESYPRDCYPCNTCNRNDETLSDQYRQPEGEEDA